MSGNRKKGIVIFLVGFLIILFSTLISGNSGEIKENNVLARNEFGGGEKEVSLIATTDQGETVIDYSIAERMFKESEIYEMLPEFLEQLELTVLGENEGIDKIDTSLNFADEIEGYPFEVIWSSDRSDLVGSEGNIKEEIKEPVTIMLTAELEYGEWMYEHSFPVVLVPHTYSPVEEWAHILEDALIRADAESSNQAYISLPVALNGTQIKWSEKKVNKGIKIGGLCIAIAFLFFFSDMAEKKEAEKKRIQQIRKAYPEFVMKCAMLVGAGMTPRQAFERIGKVYQNNRLNKNLLYEEILISNRELENRIAERQVYENFGRRCGIREAEKLAATLSRNLSKGTDGLKGALREEAKEAMAMEKEQIRKQGETAGTKLLFPMLLLLLIVMVIIMVPAFSTFSI